MFKNDLPNGYGTLPTPSEGVLVTLFITVRKVARWRAFYTEVLGGTIVLEENRCIVKLANFWIIMNSPSSHAALRTPSLGFLPYLVSSGEPKFRGPTLVACKPWRMRGFRPNQSDDADSRRA
jgi:hypothetical protein